MVDHLQVYLLEHPELRLVNDATPYDRELLYRASASRFITLGKAPTGDAVYTKDMLEQAYLWSDKGELDSVRDMRQEHD